MVRVALGRKESRKQSGAKAAAATSPLAKNRLGRSRSPSGGQQCRPPGHFTGDDLDSSEHGPGLDVLLGAIFSGLARAWWPSPGQITEAGKFAKLDSFLQGSTHPVHKRSGPMIDCERPELTALRSHRPAESSTKHARESGCFRTRGTQAACVERRSYRSIIFLDFFKRHRGLMLAQVCSK